MLVRLIDRLPRPAIIYTTLVKHAERLHDDIKANGYKRLALFTGQVDDGTSRLRIVSDWRAGNIDLVVATVLMSMGMMMMPPVTVSMPLKILLFVLVDGWNLVVRSIVLSFGG